MTYRLDPSAIDHRLPVRGAWSPPGDGCTLHHRRPEESFDLMLGTLWLMAKVQHQVRISGNVVRVVELVSRGRGRPPKHKVTTYRVHPVALATALRLAEGDASRLELHKDGSVTVANRGKL